MKLLAFGILWATTVHTATSKTRADPVNDPAKVVTRYESLIVTESELTVNCIETRRSIVINGTSPGPTLRFNTNERVLINVTNAMVSQNFTMHWHGLSMAASPWSDGTPMISQWPIRAGEWFQYEYFIGPEDEGTYYYHSHIGLQLSTAHGALIVESSNLCPGLKQPRDIPLVVADYWYKSDAYLEEGLMQEPFRWVGTPDHITLNGLSNGTCSDMDCSTKYPVIDVAYDTEYRLRWIHAGSLVYVSAAIEKHEFEVIEADGTNLKPVTVDHLEFAPGERYSTRLRTKTQRDVERDGQQGLYIINLSSRWRAPGVQNFAVLRYTVAGSRKDNSPYVDMRNNKIFESSSKSFVLPAENFGWIVRDFRALVDSPPPANPKNAVLTLRTQQKRSGKTLVKWNVNDVVFRENNPAGTGTPYLVQLYSKEAPLPSLERATSSNNFYDAVSKTYVLAAGQVVDIVIINEPGIKDNVEIHPWHFHSRKFWLMAQGPGNFDKESYEKYKLAEPYRKDMQVVYPGPGSTIRNETLKAGQTGGWAVLRYQASASDAGVFPIHCHLTPHLLQGMAAIITVSPDTLPQLLAGYAAFDKFGGAAYGNSSWVPETPHYYVDGYGSEVQEQIARQDLGNERHGCVQW